MNKKRIVFGIGLALAVLAVFTAPAMAGPNTMYFTNWTHPTNGGGSTEEGEITYVELWLNVTDETGVNPMYGLEAAQINITANKIIGKIIACDKPPSGHVWTAHWNANLILQDGVWLRIEADTAPPPPIGLDPGVYQVANLTFEGNNSGVMDLHFSFEGPPERWCDMVDSGGNGYPNQSWVDGTYTCTGPAETFDKELVAGWNLVSLPLTASDMTVTSVFSSVGGNYSAIYRYDAETNHFVALIGTDVVENGVGYFIHMTSADMWTYEGTAYTSMSIGLKQGLNMVGWLNCSKSISGNLTSIDGNYYYIASGNTTATLPCFETFNPVAPEVFNDFDEMKRGEGYFISMKTGGGTLVGGC